MIDAELATRLTEIEQRGKSNTHRIDKVEDRQDHLDELVKAVSVLDTEQKEIKSDVAEIKGDVKALTTAPARHWEDLVSQIVWAIVAAALGFFMAKLGIR